MLDEYVDIEGNMIIPVDYDKTTLPNGLIIHKNLIIKSKTLTTIPNDIIIKGGLLAPNSNLQFLPEKLILGGDLDLENSSIQYLPSELRITGSLKVSNSQLISFPQKILVGCCIYAQHIPTLQNLPRLLLAGVGIYLQGTIPITYPEFIVAGRDIIADSNYNNKVQDIYYGTFCTINANNKKQKLKLLDWLEIDNQKMVFHPVKGIVPYQRIQQYYDKKLLVGDIPHRHLLAVDTSTWEIGVDYNHYYVCSSFGDGMLQYVDTRLEYYHKTEKYKLYTSNTRVTRDEARQVYSDLSGSCSSGVSEFYNSLIQPKKYWTMKELIELTDGEVGNSVFRAFIARNEKRLKETC